MSTGLDYAAQLVNQARLARGLSLAAMSEQSGINTKTINRFELSQSTPNPSIRHKLEHFFGWETGILTKLLESESPWNVADIDELTGGLPEAQLSDDALLWEITQRLQAKDDRIQELEERITTLEAELEQYRKE